MKFSPSNNAFYPTEMLDRYESAGSLPDDLIEVSDDIFNEFMNAPPDGKVRGFSKEGYPTWIDRPKPSKEEMIIASQQQKVNMLAVAEVAINPLQDAVDLDMATDEEKAQLTAWRKYRVLLTRVDTSTAPDIDWPQAPTA